MKNLVIIVCLLLIVLSFYGCKKDNGGPDYQYLMIPAGRSFLNGSDITITINDQEYKPESVFDSCGGYWLRIPKTDLPPSGAVSIQYTRKKADLKLFKEPSTNKQKWLSAAPFIDSQNETLKAKAIELTKDYPTNLEKAKQLHVFVKQHMRLNIYHNAFLEKASKSYELGYGACMNFSRLYVALCRAVNIPARSVWGVIYGYNNDKIYDHHHQWVEVLDDDGFWHPADFDYTKNFDLNDIRYLDLIYAAEENTVIKNRSVEHVIDGNSVEYFDNYPASLTGRLGFELLDDSRPDHMTVKYTYKF